MPSSSGFSQPRDQTQVCYIFRIDIKQVSEAPMGKKKKIKAGIRGPDGQEKKKTYLKKRQVSIAPMGQKVRERGGTQQVSEAPMG